MGFGFLIPLFIIGGVIYAIYSIFDSNQTKNTNNKDALEILKERYARGEINEEEYERIKSRLLE